MIKKVVVLLVMVVVTISAASHETDKFSPLVIVPGIGGSRLYFSIPNSPKIKLIWVSPYYLLRIAMMTKFLSLKYNRTTHTSFNPYGYEYVSQGFGDPTMIEHLSNVPFVANTDYHPMVEKILRTFYYKRNTTLRAAPYDFRKAPNELGTFFESLRLLVEETFANTKGTKVVLLGHSLGCIYSLAFLNKMMDGWKQKYLKTYVCVSGPLAGAVRDILMITTGKSVLSFDNPLWFRKFEKTFPSAFFLLPRPEYFQNHTLVQTPDKKYTAKSYKELFVDMNMTNGYSLYEDVKDLVDGSQSPTGIKKVYCFHGDGVPTVESYSIKSFNDTNPEFRYGPGDGTVNLNSLQICRKWRNVQYRVIKNATHKNIVHNDEFLKRLMMILDNK